MAAEHAEFPFLSVVVPTYNEAANIAPFLKRSGRVWTLEPGAATR